MQPQCIHQIKRSTVIKDNERWPRVLIENDFQGKLPSENNKMQSSVDFWLLLFMRKEKSTRCVSGEAGSIAGRIATRRKDKPGKNG